MSCERFRTAITDHAYGAPLATTAAAHLAACAACGEVFEEQRRLMSGVDADLAEMLAVAPSPDFAARAASNAARRPQPRVSTMGWWIGAAAAAAVALTVYAGMSRQQHHEERASVARRPDVHLPPVDRRPAVAVATTTAAPHREPTRRPRENRIVRAAVAEAASTVAPGPDLEVLVQPSQARALARLRQLLRTGTLDGSQVPNAAASDELTIAPLLVPELAPQNPEIVRPPSSAVDAAATAATMTKESR